MKTAGSRAPEFAEERRAHILEMVNARGRVTVTELAQELNVTQPTIRKDISTLDEQHKLRRTHGGALATKPLYETQIDTRRYANADGKARISQICLTMIKENDSIFLDSGTTTLGIAEALATEAEGGRFGRSLNVLTNSVPVARILANVGTIHHTLLGGQLRPIADSLVGPVALQGAQQFTVNLAFIGVTGIAGNQFSVADLGEADLKRTMMGQAHRVVVPMDGSKVGLTDFVTLCRLDEISTLVTDTNNEYLEAICKAKGVELVVAP